jgi:hypothetical protein
MQLRAFLTLAATAIIVSGCASEPPIKKTYETSTIISINYLSNGTNYRNSKITYKLLPIEGGEFELRQLKVGKEFKRILKASGMEESDNPDIIVFFNFRSGGITEKEHSVPYAIRGQTGVASTTTTGTIIGGNINMRTTVIPTYGTTGYGEYKYKTYTDSYSLSMMAVDPDSLKKGNPKQLWWVFAASTGQIFGEELNLKALLMTVKDHIGSPRDTSHSTSMTRGEILNPSPDMELDVDGVAVRKNQSTDLFSPQPYSISNKNQELKKVVNNWNIYCQKLDGKYMGVKLDGSIIGCGMTDNTGVTVFIQAKGYVGTILVGGKDLLLAGSDVCVEHDADITCLKVEDRKVNHSPSKHKTFSDDLFWKLEKAKQVKITYTSDKETISKNIDMSNYSDALDSVRRSLP